MSLLSAIQFEKAKKNIGKQASLKLTLRNADEISIAVRILDVERTFGKIRYIVEPVLPDGINPPKENKTTVNADKIKVV